MKLICISDLHGQLPKLAPADVLIIAGDICPVNNHNIYFQSGWLSSFYVWLSQQPIKKVFMTWGNHDLIAEQAPTLLPTPPQHVSVLVDEAEVYEGLTFYGTPWQREFNNWAFNLTEAQLAEKYALIPEDTDVLISHGPPYGIGDLSFDRRENLGSPSLLRAIQVLRPCLSVFGHIHPGSGIYCEDEMVLINASLLNDNYQMVNRPKLVTIEEGKVTDARDLGT